MIRLVTYQTGMILRSVKLAERLGYRCLLELGIWMTWLRFDFSEKKIFR